MSDENRSRLLADGGDPETPTGLWVISLLGVFGAAIGLVSGVGIAAWGGRPAVGAGIVVLSLFQGLTMLALVSLTSWAWYAAIVLYAVSGVVNVVQDQVIGLFFSIIVIVYLGIYRDLFEI